MRRITKIITSIFLFLAVMAGSPIYARAAANFSLPPLTAGKSTVLLNNPDRGFRHELNFQLGLRSDESDPATVQAVWPRKNADGETETALETMDAEVAWYGTDHPKLAQVYLYLTKYGNTDVIPDSAFEEMDIIFTRLRYHGIKAVLRFTYDHDGDPKAQANINNGCGGRNATPFPATVVKHINQLAPWLEKWKEQIHVLQAGVIGAWGEWDGGSAGSFNGYKATVVDKNSATVGEFSGQKALLVALLENMPDDMLLQVRYQYNKFTNLTPGDGYYERVGFHDDAIRGNALFSNNSGGNSSGSADYQKVRTEGAHVLVDGELYWGTSNATGNDGAGPVSTNGLFHAVHLYQRHFTSLSIVHNYKERHLTPATYSMVEWQNEYVNPALLNSRDLPFDPDWFKDAAGNPASRSLFEYIRDYLGYYIKAESGDATVSGRNAAVSLTLRNYGFSAPHGLAGTNLVLLDSSGAVKDSVPASALDELQPLVAKTANVTLTAPAAGTYTVALEMRSASGEGARLANEITFSAEGYNLLGEVTVQ